MKQDKTKHLLFIFAVFVYFVFCNVSLLFSQSSNLPTSNQSDTLVHVLSSIASIGTCAYIIFMFKRLFSIQDKLSSSLIKIEDTLSKDIKKLGDTFLDFKILVVKEYMTTSACLGMQQKCEGRFTKLENKSDKNMEAITRLSTIANVNEQKD